MLRPERGVGVREVSEEIHEILRAAEFAKSVQRHARHGCKSKQSLDVLISRLGGLPDPAELGLAVRRARSRCGEVRLAIASSRSAGSRVIDILGLHQGSQQNQEYRGSREGGGHRYLYFTPA